MVTPLNMGRSLAEDSAVFPSPLWGGVRGGGPCCESGATNSYPPPHPSPARGEGADRVRGLSMLRDMP